jgi:hypothetical protein
LANGFTDLLDTVLPEHALWQLAEVEGSTLFYLMFGLLAAIVSWINKRKEAAKLEQASHAVPVQRSGRPAPAQAEKPTNWLAQLEQLAEAKLDKTDQKLESHYADNYEQESVETPMIIPADNLPPVIGSGAPATHPMGGTTRETFRDTPLTTQLREAKKKSAIRKSTPTPSRVYDSPIYTGNIAHRIGTDIKIARQAVVASIILGQPRSLENPEQGSRH